MRRLAAVVAVAAVGCAAHAGVALAAGSPPSTLNFDHSGTKCAGTPNLQKSPLMSQTGIAFDGRYLYVSCWGDATITQIDPTQNPAPEVHVYTISTAPYLAYGALAWDAQTSTLWACGSLYNTGTGSPERNMSEVGTINLATQKFSPQFASHGCDNGLAWDPGTNTLWTSGDTATTIYNYSMSGTQLGSRNVSALLGATPANSGIAVGGGNFYLANPQTTTKRVYQVAADFSTSTQVLSSTHRYEDMECDGQTYNTTVIWVMWFNQNILKPLPISGTCGGGAPPPPGLQVHQTNNGPVTVGTNVAFTDTATNTDTVNAQTNLTISQPLPANAAFVSVNPSAGGSCSTTSTTVSCTFALLPANSSASMVVTFGTLIPGTVTSPATAQSSQAGPVTNSAPATVTAQSSVVYYAVSSGSFTPSTQNQPLGDSVQFAIEGSGTHDLVDNSTHLYDSGALNGPTAYDVAYTAAGNFTVLDTSDSLTAKVNVVPDSPATGSLNTPIQITWASAPLPGGCTETAQVQKPGTTTWLAWISNSSSTSGMYTPTQTGKYKFRAKLACSGGSSAFSSGTSTSIS